MFGEGNEMLRLKGVSRGEMRIISPQSGSLGALGDGILARKLWPFKPSRRQSTKFSQPRGSAMCGELGELEEWVKAGLRMW